jgi:hypothetical protein
MRRLLRWTGRVAVVLAVLLLGPAATVATGLTDIQRPWWEGRRGGSAGLAPSPSAHTGAVVQVYGARTRGWRGAFAIHTWVAAKPQGADHYTRYEVIGWRYFRGGRALQIRETAAPDGWWFGNEPALLYDLRGPAAASLIPEIETAVDSYPHADFYRTWPGPNSNSFTAHIGRTVPSMGLDLPPTAIGKDYNGAPIGRSPGGGLQLSLFGLLGVLVSPAEGIEVNLLGLSFGLDLLQPGLRLPGVGIVSPPSR